MTTLAYNFPLLSNGVPLPQENGYQLLSALSKNFPFLHGDPKVQIAPLRGTRTRDNKIRLDQHSLLHIRGISEEQAQGMEDTMISVKVSPNTACFLGIGVSDRVLIKPFSTLVSRLVVFPDAIQVSEFLQKLSTSVPEGTQMVVGKQRGLHNKGRIMLGHSVALHGLSDEESLRIQSHGLGKYTSMGCGVFYPGSRTRAPQ